MFYLGKICFTFLVILLSLFSAAYSADIEGIIDIIPKGFMGNSSTPYAIHFGGTTSAFTGFSVVTVKVRVNSGSSAANSYTWSTVGIAGWRNDVAGLNTLPLLTVVNNTVSGWLFVKSTATAYFGASTCIIRLYRTTANTFDLTSYTPY